MRKVICVASLFLVTAGILSLVNSNNPQTRNNLPITTITPPDSNQSNNTSANATLENYKEIEKIRTVLNSAKISNEEVEFSNQKLYKEIKHLTQKSQLTDLENVKLSKNNKEIRIWNLETLFTGRTKGYIFTFIDGQWKGSFMIDAGKKSHFKEINFDEPLSGWQNWEIFVENEIAPTKVECSNSQIASTDGTALFIEVKFGQKYAKNVFYNPGITENTAGDIIRKIRVEFYNNRIKWSDY